MIGSLRKSSRKPTMESREAPYIHPDILRQLLSKLPVKSLLRFRPVCKSWNRLISKSDFVTLHLEQSVKQNEKIILSPTDHQMYFDSINSKSFHKQHPMERHEFPPEFQGSRKSVVGFGSCNGLILLVDCHENLFLWNPSTRESRKLSCPHMPKYQSKKIYGLSYDSENNDYMLAVVNFIDYETTFYDILFLSLNKLEWTKINFHSLSYHHCETLPELPAVILNGALHWFVVGHDKGNGDAYMIVAFDLATQSLKEMKLPTHLDSLDGIENFSLGVFSGCLCLIGGSCDDISKDVCVHSMEIYGDADSWVTRIQFTYKEDAPYMGPCAFTNKGDILMELVKKKKCVIVNSETMKKKEIPMDTDKYTVLFAHVESLVSVHGTSKEAATDRKLRRKRKISQ